MPYVTREKREEIFQNISEGLHHISPVIMIEEITTAGEIQYAIAELLKNFVERQGKCYQTMNDIMGALAGAQMEFYRRNVAPYEDDKIKENGDV